MVYSRLGRFSIPVGVEAIAPLLRQYFALVFIACLLVMIAVLPILFQRKQNKCDWLALILICGFAVGFRWLLLETTPWLTNDIYRYHWDAQVLDRGINPYSYAPQAPELSALQHTEAYSKMDHRHVHTVYPPFLQAVFWLGLRLSPMLKLAAATGIKTMFVLFDLAVIVVLGFALRQHGQRPELILLYAWHPLTIIEIAGSGHTDVAGAFLLIAALVLLAHQNYLLAALALAFGFLVKFITLLFLPFVLIAAYQRAGWRRTLVIAGSFAAVIIASYVPFLTASKELISGLLVYSGKWRFNDALFSLIFNPLCAMLPDWLVIWAIIPKGWVADAQTLTTHRIDLALLITKSTVAFIFVFIYWQIWRRAFAQLRQNQTPDWRWPFLVILAAFLLLSPTVQPWYLLWLLPLLCVNIDANRSPLQQAALAAMWCLSATVFLSYHVLVDYLSAGVWRESGWIKFVEHAIPLAMGIWVYGWRRRALATDHGNDAKSVSG